MNRRHQRHHYMRNEYRNRKYVRKPKKKPEDFNLDSVLSHAQHPADSSSESDLEGFDNTELADRSVINFLNNYISNSEQSSLRNIERNIDINPTNEDENHDINCSRTADEQPSLSNVNTAVEMNTEDVVMSVAEIADLVDNGNNEIDHISNADEHQPSSSGDTAVAHMAISSADGLNQEGIQEPVNDGNNETDGYSVSSAATINGDSLGESINTDDYQSEHDYDTNEKELKFVPGFSMSDAQFMLLNFYIRHKLTQEALVDLLRMLNVFTGLKNFPENFETFSSFFPDPYGCLRIYFCTNCQCEYGNHIPPEGTVCTIPGCNSDKFDFFVVLPIEQQIRETIKKYKKEIEEYEKTVEEEKIADISKGSVFKKVIAGDDHKYISLSVNTDGAAAYRWTINKPCYPIFLVINNLPPRLRFSKHNIILAGIWLSKGDPNMCLFFKHFCKETKSLRNDFKIDSNAYKVVVLQACVDSVARPKLQGTTQFNGKFGCSICLHEGKLTNGKQIRYPYQRSEQRQPDETRRIMLEVNDSGIPQLGIKGLSVFMFMPDFDVIHGFPPDYMHGVLLGVVKMMWELYTSSCNHRQPFYMGPQLKEVEKRMISIRPPSSFPRYPGKLEDIKKNKATDWENILYHYFYPCFYGILPQRFMDHFMVLSTSVFTLLDVNLTPDQINQCESSLNSFVEDFENIYGEDKMVFNIHLLTHLSESARCFGALWNSSLYPYESANGLVLSYRTGNNHPVLQISKKYILNRICQHTAISNSSPVYAWHSRIWHPSRKQELKYDNRFVYEVPLNIYIDEDIVEREFTYHNKIRISGIQYCTKQYCEKLGYDNSYVYIAGEFFRIENILTDKNNNTYIVGLKLVTCKIFENMFTYSISDCFTIKRTNIHFRQCISIIITHNGEIMRFISMCKFSSQID